MEVFIPTTFCACLKPDSVIAMKIFRSLNCDAYVIYVAQSLVFYVVFVCIIVCVFVVALMTIVLSVPSSMYCFCLQLWYLKTCFVLSLSLVILCIAAC